MKYLLLSLIISSLLVTVKTLHFGILSDVHLQPYYDPSQGVSTYCLQSNTTNSSVPIAPFGRPLCDSPKLLLTKTLSVLLSQATPAYDAILIPGDLVGHGIPIDPVTGGGNYTLLKQTIQTVIQDVKQVFPNTPIFVTLGNNDGKYHYQAPNEDEKKEYYSFIYENIITQVEANQKYNISNINQTILTGGYYRIDFNENLVILCLNTLYFNIQNNVTLQANTGQQQIDWFEQQLRNSNENQKFIIMYHIYPGCQIQKQIKSQLWYDNFNTLYLTILHKYKSKIIIEISAHDHLSDLRFHTQDSTNAEGIFHNIWLSPGLSPVYGNVPGISRILIDDVTLVPQDIVSTFFDIEAAFNTDGEQQISTKSSFSYKTNFNLQDISTESIQLFNKQLQNDNPTALSYLIQKIGCLASEQSACINQFYVKFQGVMDENSNNVTRYLCLMSQSLTTEELNTCISSISKFEK